MHLNYFYFEGSDTHLKLTSTAFLINGIAESSWLELTKLIVPLGQQASIHNRYPEWLTLFGWLHPMWDEVYHSALAKLMQAAVTSNHCGQHTKKRETLPIHLTLLDLPSTARLTFVSCSTALTLAASALYIAGGTTGGGPQAFGENHGQHASCPQNKLLSYWRSLSRRRGHTKFLTLYKVWYDSLFWYLALHGNLDYT